MDTTGCVGTTIKTAQGAYVDLLNPDPKTIDINSIAQGLSKICRFGGQCPFWYSVAEHSFLAAELAMWDGHSAECARAILFHDAAEAYIGDMVKPLKVTDAHFQKVEAIMEEAVGEALDIDFEKWRKEIRKYDLIMLKAEKKAMWPNDSVDWTGLSEVEDRQVQINFMDHNSAYHQFISMAHLVAQ